MATKKTEDPVSEKNGQDQNPLGENAKVDLKLQKEMYQKEKEIEEKDEEIKKLRAQLAQKPAAVPVSKTAEDELNELRARIDSLSRQVIAGARGEKLLFRPPSAADVVDDPVTFTARSVFYIVGSHLDSKGLEVLPPHKLIVFTYQASDIRKDGKEEVIKNFSQYTTNLRTEIEFLRKHPHYGISFSENTNEMMDEDTRDTQFKLQAANQLSVMSPEAVFDRAMEYKIPNWQQKTAEELRYLIVHRMAEQFKKEAKDLQDDIIRRRVIASVGAQNRSQETE